MNTSWPREWLKKHLPHWVRAMRARLRAQQPTDSACRPVTHRRFLSDQPQRGEAFLQAARQYVGGLDEDNLAWLYAKPFDSRPGNVDFYTELYQILNLLQMMALPGGARVLEVGSGPGWVTEILMLLGFEVNAVEPCGPMIRIAQERLDACRRHHRLAGPPRVTFHCQALEDCDLPDGCCDAALFHESLHHVIDEHEGLAQCYRVLRPGGILGICEGAWHPGDRRTEAIWEAEMARSGTLENPYTQSYLDALLREHGFEHITRYHGINGLYPTTLGEVPIKHLAQFPASHFNTLTAVKPGAGPDTRDPEAKTSASIQVVTCERDFEARKAHLKVRLSNTGETTWLNNRGFKAGYVTLSLHQGKPGSAECREAHPRHLLPQPVAPGHQLLMDAVFDLPEAPDRAPWYVDLLNEHHFWFSSRGTVPAEVTWR